jgi:hypothetical protein
MTDFVNLNIKSVQSFKITHRDSVCVHKGEYLYIYVYLHLYCVSKNKNEKKHTQIFILKWLMFCFCRRKAREAFSLPRPSYYLSPMALGQTTTLYWHQSFSVDNEAKGARICGLKPFQNFFVR